MRKGAIDLNYPLIGQAMICGSILIGLTVAIWFLAREKNENLV